MSKKNRYINASLRGEDDITNIYRLFSFTIMTYIVEKPANTVAVGEKQLVTIEFTSFIHPD